MSVLVDTPLWSLALRRSRRRLSRQERMQTFELAELIKAGQTAIIGPVRQEVLSGIRDQEIFERLRDYLRHFDDEELHVEDFEEAARLNNRCIAAGLVGSPTDFLICAVALRMNYSIFTNDTDFSRYARHLPVRLHTPGT